MVWPSFIVDIVKKTSWLPLLYVKRWQISPILQPDSVTGDGPSTDNVDLFKFYAPSNIRYIGGKLYMADSNYSRLLILDEDDITELNQ